MEISLTSKLRIMFQSEEDRKSAFDTLIAYRDACNYVSQYIFEHDFVLKQSDLQSALYHELRNRFGLKSQMTQSVFKTVIARYKAVQTQLNKQRVWDGYKKDNHGKDIPNYINKDLTFLWKPIEFKRPQLDLVRNRDYNFKNDLLSMNTINGRIFVKVYGLEENHYFDGSWKLGTGKVVRSGKHWFFHVSVTKEVPEFEMPNLKHVVGIDRGLRQILTSYDEKGQTRFVNGAFISKKRKHYAELRARLQAKGTKSAKRRLRSLSGRESRWMSDVNHQLSKTLVQTYGKQTLFVLEDLTGVTFETVHSRKKENRYEHHSWAFYDLEQKLRYKAHLNQSEVVLVDAHYTSQRCPKCGTIDKSNRDKGTHQYTCSNCGYSSNDDRVGAMNIYELGKWFVSGIEEPAFSITNK